MIRWNDQTLRVWPTADANAGAKATFAFFVTLW